MNKNVGMSPLTIQQIKAAHKKKITKYFDNIRCGQKRKAARISKLNDDESSRSELMDSSSCD